MNEQALRSRCVQTGTVGCGPSGVEGIELSLDRLVSRVMGMFAEPARAKGLALEAAEVHAGRRILLVEDNPVNCELAKALLEAAGLVVECANDGVQAVEAALASHHDLILMDMQMPRLDGVSATRAIRQAGCTVPIVAMAASTFKEDAETCLAAGMNDYMDKPAPPAVFYATVLRWLDAAVPVRVA